MPEIKRLIDLEGLEVSLVPAGAVRERFFLTKNDNRGEITMDELLDKILKGDLDNAEAIETVLKAEKLPERAANAVKGALRLLSSVKEDLPEAARGGLMAKLAGMVGYDFPEPKKETEKTQTKKEDKMPVLKEDGSYDLEGVPEAVRGPIELLWKERNEAKDELVTVKKELDETKAKYDKEIDDKVNAEFVAKAAEFKNIGVNPTEYGPVLRKLHDTDKTAYEKHLSVLKAADTANVELFKEVGTSGDNNATGSAWDRIEKAADVIVIEKKITKEQAISQVLKDKPELYKEYRNESN